MALCNIIDGIFIEQSLRSSWIERSIDYHSEAIADIDSNVENGEINALSFCPNQSALFSSSDSNILYWTF